jgi:hypothetical protein
MRTWVGRGSPRNAVLGLSLVLATLLWSGAAVAAAPRTPFRTGPVRPSTLQEEEVRLYLWRLWRFEQDRIRLEAQLQSSVTRTTFPSALRAYTRAGRGDWNARDQERIVQRTARDFATIQSRIMDLNAQYPQRAMPVPPSCAKLNGTYFQALQALPSVISQLKDALLRRDQAAVERIQRYGQAQVDSVFHAADAELESVYRFQGVPKSFSLGTSKHGLLDP